MRKAELEEHHDQDLAKEARIREMVRDRQFPPVFTVCVDSFPHLVHAMKYRKRVGTVPETPEFSAFSVICKYAPVLFEHSFIVAMHEFILANRQLARHENGYLQPARRPWNWKKLRERSGIISNGIRVRSNGTPVLS